MAKSHSVHKRLTVLLQQSDVPKLRQTIGAALAHGASMRVLLEKLTETIEGTYRARGDYSETQYDVVTLVVRLGGPKLLFALARPLGLPSLSDWRIHRQNLKQLLDGQAWMTCKRQPCITWSSSSATPASRTSPRPRRRRRGRG
jgi:hypothetical protein